MAWFSFLKRWLESTPRKAETGVEPGAAQFTLRMDVERAVLNFTTGSQRVTVYSPSGEMLGEVGPTVLAQAAIPVGQPTRLTPPPADYVVVDKQTAQIASKPKRKK